MQRIDPSEATQAFAGRYRRRAPGLVVGAMRGRDCTAIAGTGQTCFPHGPAPDATTLFEIGSITKVFTSLLLAIAVTRGEVTLDTPLRTLLPPGAQVPQRGAREITLEHLATHRSGLPRSPLSTSEEFRIWIRGGNPYADLDPARLLEILARTPLQWSPGSERIAYSNFGGGLLGMALDTAAGSPGYAALVRRRICEPLGLADTDVLEQVITDPTRACRLARGHGWGRRPVAHWSLSGMAGAGALLSTANDLLTFLSAQLSPEATPLAEAIRMTQPPRAGTRRSGLGLGWVLSARRTGTVQWHNGSTTGFDAFAGLLAERHAAVVVFGNPFPGLDGPAMRLLSRL